MAQRRTLTDRWILGVGTWLLVLGCSRAVPEANPSPAAAHRARLGQNQKDAAPKEGSPSERARPDLRRSTVLVRPQQPEAFLKVLKDLGQRRANLGAEWAEAATKSFGSGVVFVDGKDKSAAASGAHAYVVTNRHVLGYAESAKVSFPTEARELEAVVRYVDPDYDLGVLELPRDVGFELTGFDWTAREVHDQDEVIAAGYPGIAGDPSYQVTRGYVSNEQVVLRDYGTLPYIQHTAPIDPGSSGGPLVTLAGSLVGLNTLKLREREGVGLAIPGAQVLKALREAQRPQVPDADKTCARLAALLSADEPALELLDLLSAEWLSEEGPRSLIHLGTDSVWRTRFAEDPALVLGAALSVRLYRTFGTEKRTRQVTCSAVKAEGPDRTFQLVSGTRRAEVTFRLEQTIYKIARADLNGPSGYGFLEKKPPRTRKEGWKPQLR